MAFLEHVDALQTYLDSERIKGDLPTSLIKQLIAGAENPPTMPPSSKIWHVCAKDYPRRLRLVMRRHQHHVSESWLRRNSAGNYDLLIHNVWSITQ